MALLDNKKVVEKKEDNIKFGQRIQRDTLNFDCFIEEFKIWLEAKGLNFPVP